MINTDAIFNMNKIRFDKLDELISSQYEIVNVEDKVNVFINLESVFDNIININNEKYFRSNIKKRVKEIVANILNLASHYRLYFAKYGIFSRVILYLPYPFSTIYKNNSIIDDYRDLYRFKYSNNLQNHSVVEVLNESIRICKTILEYVNNVYLLESNKIEPSLLPLLFTSHIGDSQMNFIVTRDPYEYQYVNQGFHILRPKKKNESYIVCKDNVIETLKKENKSKNSATIDTKYLSFILALLGSRKRNIEKVKRIGLMNIIKFINKELKSKKLSPDIVNVNILSDVINPEFKDQMIENFYCTDLEYQSSLINSADLYMLTNQIVDRFDNDGLKNVCSIFDEDQIHILELVSGDKYYRKKG